MIRLLLGALIFAMCTATATGQASETIEGPDVAQIIKKLHESAEIDTACDAATKLVIAYRGEAAHIFLVLNDRPCGVLTGPAAGVRALIKSVQGQPV